MNTFKDFVMNNEGTWHLPGDRKVAANFKKAMQKPIPLGDGGEDAINKLEPFIGDDRLFDDIGTAGDKSPDKDARGIIRKSFKRLSIDPKTHQWTGSPRESVKEAYDKANKASLTIKNGYDEGDGPDNQKLVKFIAKKAGAEVKLGKNGTMVINGSDEQIHKALQIHYSDDKKGLGDLNYHKTGKTSSDDHVKGMFSYKAESYIYEDSKAGKYKKGELIVMGQWPSPDAWVKEYVLPNIDKKGVRIYSTGPSFKIEKL